MKNSKPYREYDRWETKAKKSANREYRDKKSDQSLQLAVEPPEPRGRFDPILYDTFPEDIDEAMALDEAMARWRDHGEFYVGSTSDEPNSGWGK